MSTYKVSLSVGSSSPSANQERSSYFESTEVDRDAAWINGSPSSVKVSQIKNLFDFSTNEKIIEQPNKSFIQREIDELKARDAEWKQTHGSQSLISPAVTMTEEKLLVSSDPIPSASAKSNALMDFEADVRYSTPKSTMLAQGSPDSGYQDGGSDSKSVSAKMVTTRKAVTFEDPEVHHRPENPKEKDILDEIEQEKKREEELRRHWKDLGLDATLNGFLDGSDNVSGRQDIQSNGVIKDTEVQMLSYVSAEPEIKVNTNKQAKPVPSALSFEAEAKQKVVEKSTPEIKVKSLEKSYTSNLSSGISSIHPEPLSPNPAGRSQTVELAKRTMSVQPFSDDEDDENDEKRFWLAPQSETFIQREIKAAREREEALRIARGLPSLLGMDQVDNSPVTIDVSKPARQVSVSTDQRDAMKKYAESRLQVELKKEKEKELALLRQGSIHTLSEERIGEPAKFIEIISPETERMMQERAIKKQQEKENQEREKQAALKIKTEKQVALNIATDKVDGPLETKVKEVKVEATNAAKNDKISKPENKAEASTYNAAGNTVFKLPQCSSSSLILPSWRNTPKVFLTYSYDPTGTSSTDSHEAVSRSAAGAFIQKEVEEAKRREEELKQMRESLRDEIAKYGLTLPASSPASKQKPAAPLTAAAVVLHSTDPASSRSKEDLSLERSSASSTPSTAPLSAAPDINLLTLENTAVRNTSPGASIQVTKVKVDDHVMNDEITNGLVRDIIGKVESQAKSGEVKVSKDVKVEKKDGGKKEVEIVKVEVKKDERENRDGVINEQTPKMGDELISAERRKLLMVREWEQKIIYGASASS